jgi:hypothetical protein
LWHNHLTLCSILVYLMHVRGTSRAHIKHFVSSMHTYVDTLTHTYVARAVRMHMLCTCVTFNVSIR